MATGFTGLKPCEGLAFLWGVSYTAARARARIRRVHVILASDLLRCGFRLQNPYSAAVQDVPLNARKVGLIASLQFPKPRFNRVNRCAPFQVSFGSNFRHQGGRAHPSTLTVLEFLCHFAISDSYFGGPKPAATARTFNAFFPGCDCRFVINDSELMNIGSQ